MKKISVILAIISVFCLFGAVGCVPTDVETAKYTVSVTCGTNGSYEITNEGEVEENSTLTLTVKPDNGFETDTVKLNDKTVNLVDNKYTFTVTEDTNITITFKANDPINNDPCSVHISYNYSGDGEYSSAMGSATISPKKDKYDEGDKIVLTVTAGRGYETDSVTVNGKNATLAMGTTNSYRIDVTGTMDIVVTFKDGEGEIDPNLLWLRDWISLDENILLSVKNENDASLTVGGNEIQITKVDLNSSALTLTGSDNNLYSFAWFEGFGIYDGIVKNKIVTYNDGNSTKLLIPTDKVEIDEDFNGTWYSYYGDGTFTVDTENDTATVNGRNVSVVDCGYIHIDPTYNFDMHDPDDPEDKPMIIDHVCYYFVANDSTVYFIGWYKDDTQQGAEFGRVYNGPTLTSREELYEPYINEIYIDPMLQGSWRSFTQPQIVIDVDVTTSTIKVDGEKVTVLNKGATKGSGNIIRMGNKAYTLTPYENYIMREEMGGGMGIGKRDYFLKSDKDPVHITEPSLINTEWEDKSKAHTLRIDEEGNLTYDRVTYYIFTAGMLDNGYYQATAFSATNLNVNITYLPKTPNSLQVDNGVTVNNFIKKTGQVTEIKAGFLGLAMGTYYDVAGATYSVEIKEDSMIIDATLSGLGSVDGQPLLIEVTEEMLEEETPIYGSSKHYSFMWTDLENNIFFKTCHIALDVEYTPVVGEETTTEYYKLMITIGEYEDRFFILPEVPVNESNDNQSTTGETAFTEEKKIR